MARRLLLTIVAALVVTGIATAAVPRNGTFKGTTSQKQKLTMQVRDGAIDTFAVTVKCGARTIQAMSFPAVKAKANGSFAFKDPVAKISVTGTFTTPTAASGKIVPSGAGCKPLTFTAKR
jgi:hypothetical protein